MYIYVAIALIAAAASGFGTWRVQEWRHDSIEKARIEAENEARRQAARKVDGAAVGHEQDKERVRTEFVTITKEVERIVAKPEYSDVCIDDDGMRVLKDAIGSSVPVR